ncbi:MAG TPA: XRE family transcriptional regulator [Porphyromonadaceae bacterium]|nr:XRE family transcriptional regulator [Porphyromonadaceae bacterium]
MKTKRGSILTNIHDIRKDKGFTQEYVASRLGIKQSGYGLIENGERGLQYDLLLQLAIIFEMDIIDIIAYPDTCSLDSRIAVNTTKVLVELEVSNDEFIKLGLKEKVLQILNK